VAAFFIDGQSEQAFLLPLPCQLGDQLVVLPVEFKQVTLIVADVLLGAFQRLPGERGIEALEAARCLDRIGSLHGMMAGPVEAVTEDARQQGALANESCFLSILLSDAVFIDAPDIQGRAVKRPRAVYIRNLDIIAVALRHPVLAIFVQELPLFTRDRRVDRRQIEAKIVIKAGDRVQCGDFIFPTGDDRHDRADRVCRIRPVIFFHLDDRTLVGGVVQQPLLHQRLQDFGQGCGCLRSVAPPKAHSVYGAVPAALE